MLRVGTDCSGIEAPIQALNQLDIPFSHVFSSDIDKYCIKSIKANYSPGVLFGDLDGKFSEGDITKRNVSDVPNIDLYVCGFPCQPFSMAGNRKGFEDKRGNVFWSCVDVIKNKKPTYFILENVKGLLSHKNGETFGVIKNELQKLKEIGYFVDWKILNTKDYGIPHNRERLYIVGIKDKQVIWPNKEEMKNINNYYDNTTVKKDIIRNDVIKSKMMEKIPVNSVFVDFSFKKHNYPNSDKYCPTIAADSRLWCVPMHRYVTCKERLKLQGFSDDFIQDVSDTQLKKQIGNSMSVNVLTQLIKCNISITY